jgi:hypothetical protein
MNGGVLDVLIEQGWAHPLEGLRGCTGSHGNVGVPVGKFPTTECAACGKVIQDPPPRVSSKIGGGPVRDACSFRCAAAIVEADDA